MDTCSEVATELERYLNHCGNHGKASIADALRAAIDERANVKIAEALEMLAEAVNTSRQGLLSEELLSVAAELRKGEPKPIEVDPKLTGQGSLMAPTGAHATWDACNPAEQPRPRVKKGDWLVNAEGTSYRAAVAGESRLLEADSGERFLSRSEVPVIADDGRIVAMKFHDMAGANQHDIGPAKRMAWVYIDGGADVVRALIAEGFDRAAWHKRLDEIEGKESK